MTLDDIVDLERYPLHQPASPALAQAVAAARAGLQRQGCAVLGGFMRPQAVALVAEESRRLKGKAHRYERVLSAYPPFDPPEEGAWPAGHPRNWRALRNNRFIPYDRIAPQSPLRRLYESRPMTDLIRRCLGKPALHLYGDPLGACLLSLQGEGEEFPWHFDVTHFVVSLLVQSPGRGGRFQYAPHIKTGEDERYGDVAAVLDGSSAAIVTLDMQPGDLQLFEGRHSLHRVTAPQGEGERCMALLSYCENAGEISKPALQINLYGRADQTPLVMPSASACPGQDGRGSRI